MLPRPVFCRPCPGGILDTPRCVPEVDRVNLCGCGTCDVYFLVTLYNYGTFPTATAFCLLAAAFAAYSLRIEYCCPVSGPAWPRRGRFRSFAAARRTVQAMGLSCPAEQRPSNCSNNSTPRSSVIIRLSWGSFHANRVPRAAQLGLSTRRLSSYKSAMLKFPAFCG